MGHIPRENSPWNPLAQRNLDFLAEILYFQLAYIRRVCSMKGTKSVWKSSQDVVEAVEAEMDCTAQLRARPSKWHLESKQITI